MAASLFVLGERSTVPSVHADLPPRHDRARHRGERGAPSRLLDYDHAVFKAFLGPRSGDFSTPPSTERAGSTSPTGRVTARFDDGSPALVEGRRGKGLILIWATGLDRFWNTCRCSPCTCPSCIGMTTFLGGRGEIPPWHLAGSTVNLSALAEAGSTLAIPAGAVAMEPGGGSVALDPETSLLRLARRGIWEIRPPGERPEHPMALAANVDVTESDMTTMDIEEFLGAVGGEPADGEAEDDTRAADAAAAELQATDFEGRQSFWRYLLAAVFLLMVSETVLANGLSRRRTEGGSGAMTPP